MRKYKHSRAMSIVEYSLLIAIIVAAIVGMQLYLKRSTNDRFRQAADAFGFGRQYQAPRPIVWEP